MRAKKTHFFSKMITNVLLDSHRISVLPTNQLNELTKFLETTLNLTSNEFYLTQNGKRLTNDSNLVSNINVYIHLKLFGGKGGFGSMLRAIGAQIEKTTNREACRDLSGRRLRDINEEKRVKSWLEKQEEREEEAANKTSKKIEKLKAKPKHDFQDEQYFNARSNLAQNVSDALEEGLKNVEASTSSGSGTMSSQNNDEDNDKAASGSGTKRKHKKIDKKSKKKIKGAHWLDEGLSSSSDDSDESSVDSDSSTSNKSTANESTTTSSTAKNAIAI